MRRFIPLASYIFIVNLLLAVLFKLMHWPGANQMLIVGGGSLIFIIPFYLIIRVKETKSQLGQICYLMLIGSICISILGVLFKIMHWPGANEMCILGFASTAFPTLLLYVIFQTKKTENNFKENYLGFFGLLLFCLILLIIIRIPRSSVLDSYQIIEDSIETSNQVNIELNQQRINEMAKDTSAEKYSALHTDVMSVFDFIEELKKEIINGAGSRIDKDGKKEYKRDDMDAPMRILIDKRNGTTLYLKLMKLKSNMKSMDGEEHHFECFNTYSRELINEKSWANIRLAQMPASGAIAFLSSIQSNILIEEYKIVNKK